MNKAWISRIKPVENSEGHNDDQDAEKDNAANEGLVKGGVLLKTGACICMKPEKSFKLNVIFSSYVPSCTPRIAQQEDYSVRSTAGRRNFTRGIVRAGYRLSITRRIKRISTHILDGLSSSFHLTPSLASWQSLHLQPIHAITYEQDTALLCHRFAAHPR